MTQLDRFYFFFDFILDFESGCMVLEFTKQDFKLFYCLFGIGGFVSLVQKNYKLPFIDDYKKVEILYQVFVLSLFLNLVIRFVGLNIVLLSIVLFFTTILYMVSIYLERPFLIVVYILVLVSVYYLIFVLDWSEICTNVGEGYEEGKRSLKENETNSTQVVYQESLAFAAAGKSEVFGIEYNKAKAQAFYMMKQGSEVVSGLGKEVGKAVGKSIGKSLIKSGPKPVFPDVLKLDFLSKPVTEPVEKPVEKPVAKPVAEPVVEPLTKPGVKPLIKPVGKPFSNPLIKLLGVKPVGKSLCEPFGSYGVKAGIAKPVIVPGEKPVVKLGIEPFGKPLLTYLEHQKSTAAFEEKPIKDSAENPVLGQDVGIKSLVNPLENLSLSELAKRNEIPVYCVRDLISILAEIRSDALVDKKFYIDKFFGFLFKDKSHALGLGDAYKLDPVFFNFLAKSLPPGSIVLSCGKEAEYRLYHKMLLSLLGDAFYTKTIDECTLILQKVKFEAIRDLGFENHSQFYSKVCDPGMEKMDYLCRLGVYKALIELFYPNASEEFKNLLIYGASKHSTNQHLRNFHEFIQMLKFFELVGNFPVFRPMLNKQGDFVFTNNGCFVFGDFKTVFSAFNTEKIQSLIDKAETDTFLNVPKILDYVSMSKRLLCVDISVCVPPYFTDSQVEALVSKYISQLCPEQLKKIHPIFHFSQIEELPCDKIGLGVTSSNQGPILPEKYVTSLKQEVGWNNLSEEEKKSIIDMYNNVSKFKYEEVKKILDSLEKSKKE